MARAGGAGNREAEGRDRLLTWQRGQTSRPPRWSCTRGSLRGVWPRSSRSCFKPRCAPLTWAGC